MADEYTIRTVADFAKIPEDKLQECLADFVQFLAMIRCSQKINQAIHMEFELPEGSVNLETDVFHWIDDGKRGLSTVEFVVKETGEKLGRINFADNAES